MVRDRVLRIATPPSESDLRLKLKWVMLFRLALLSVLLGGSIMLCLRTYPASKAFDYLYILIGLLFGSTAVYLVLLRSWGRLQLLAQIHIHLDVLFVSAFIFLSGGAQSIFQFLYILAVISAGILLGGKGAFFCAGSCSIFYGLIVTFEFHKIITPLYLQPHTQVSMTATAVLVNLITHISAFFVVAYLTSYLSAQLFRTQKALRERVEDVTKLEALNEWILESIDSGLLTLGRTGRILSWNTAAERILGFSSEEAVGKGFAELLPEVMGRPGIRTGGGVDATGPPRLETTARRKDGRTVHVGFSVSPLSGPDGQRHGMTVIFQDVTELKHYQEKAQRLERLAMLGKLAAGMAHEIRNPLGSISGALQMLQRGRVSEELSERLTAIIDREISRLNDLLSEFLWLAKTPRPPGDAPVIDPVPMIDETIMLVRSKLPVSDRIRFTRNAEPGIRIAMSEDHLRQVLWNLISNAVAASRDGGDIRITMRRTPEPEKNGEVVFEVEDQGEGMDVETMRQAFEPFYTTRTNGTGLGLTVVQSIVENYGGTIDVTSAPGKGATFRAVLPGPRRSGDGPG